MESASLRKSPRRLLACTLLEQWLDARKLPYPAVAKKPYKMLEAICR